MDHTIGAKDRRSELKTGVRKEIGFRPQESEKENDQEKKKVGRERVFFPFFLFFLIAFWVESVFSCLLTSLFSFINSTSSVEVGSRLTIRQH